ncbi:hypothetical protein [Arthrobacter sp.]|nr:hypothetical protein [Arthrobacter sp.]
MTVDLTSNATVAGHATHIAAALMPTAEPAVDAAAQQEESAT